MCKFTMKYWREKSDPKKHINFMSNSNMGGVPVKKSKDNLCPDWVYFANVCKFTFSFFGIEQVKECRKYFSKPIIGSTIRSNVTLEHYWHPWYSRLPKNIKSNKNRVKVVKVLDKIIDEWG